MKPSLDLRYSESMIAGEVYRIEAGYGHKTVGWLGTEKIGEDPGGKPETQEYQPKVPVTRKARIRVG